MTIVINFKRMKWCFNSNNNNNNKRLSCMVYLVMHKAFIIIIKTPFYPFKLYICNTLLLTRLNFLKYVFSLTIILLIFF